MHPLLVLAIAIAVVFLLIIRFHINAFIALIAAAITVGLLSPEVRLQNVMPRVTELFGALTGRIGIVIALAALIGQCLMESGAADKITRVFVRTLGQGRSSLAMVTSGYVLSIPVFFDTVFYLLIPLARAMRVRVGKNYLLFVMSIAAGGVVTHSMVPPTPGPLGMAATLNIDMGTMILVGAIIGAPMSIVGWLFAVWRDRTLDIPLRETPGLSLDELEELAHSREEKLPGFLHSMAPIVLPVIMITANTVLRAASPQHSLVPLFSFLGDPNFALFISAIIAVQLLMQQKGYTLRQLVKPVEEAFMSAGLIILITAAGGAFGGMLVEAGVGRTLGDMARAYNVPFLLLGFLLGALLKFAQGSGTVAMITSASIMAPLVSGAQLPYHTVYIACAIASGSLVGAWMNDSGFWVYKQMSGFTELESLKTWTPLLAIVGVTGYVFTQIVSLVLPLR